MASMNAEEFPLTPLDAGFLQVEDADRHSSLAIGAVAIVDGPAPPHSQVLATLAQRLPLAPRAYQKLHFSSLDLHPPRWVPDEQFDIGWHVRRAALPGRGTDEALGDFVAQEMAQRMDRDRPLWQCWVIEGLAGGRWALLVKMHHCMADGIAGVALLEALCDRSGPSEDAPPAHSPPQATAVEGFVHRQFRALTHAATLPATVGAAAVRSARGAASLAADLLIPSAPTPLLGPIGAARRYRAVSVSLPQVREVCSAFAVTINDVALTATTSGLRALMLSRGESPGDHSVRVLVPASVRVNDSAGNQVSLLLPELPVHVADPLAQLATIHARMGAHKAGGESSAGHSVTSLAEHSPFLPLAWAVRLASRFPQHSIAAVATNVPGPHKELRLFGAPILRILPYVPIAMRLRVGVAVLSYVDQLSFGVTTDYDTVPDVSEVTAAMEQAVAVLLAAARSGAVLWPVESTQ